MIFTEKLKSKETGRNKRLYNGGGNGMIVSGYSTSSNSDFNKSIADVIYHPIKGNVSTPFTTSQLNIKDALFTYDDTNGQIILNKNLKVSGDIISEGDVKAFSIDDDIHSILDKLPIATKTSKGLVQVGENINVNNGVISINENALNPTLSFASNVLHVNGSTVNLSGLAVDAYTKIESNNRYAYKAHSHDYTNEFAAKTHNHDTKYLGKAAKATDSNLLDGINSSDFMRCHKSVSGYKGMSVADNDGSWIRTTKVGLIPYSSSSSDKSQLGTSSWNFKAIYGKTLYEGNIALSSKYHPKNGNRSTAFSTSQLNIKDALFTYDGTNLILNKNIKIQGNVVAEGDITAFSAGDDVQSIIDRLPKASKDVYGIIRVGTGLNVSNGLVSVDNTALNPTLSFSNNTLRVNGSSVSLSSLSIDAYTKTQSNSRYAYKSHSHNYAASNHTHGLLHSSLAVHVANTTTDSGWSMLNSSYNGFLLKSIRTQAKAPSWLLGDYSAGIAFGGADTKGVLSVRYNTPQIRVAGGNGTSPNWNVDLYHTSNANKTTINWNAKILTAAEKTKTPRIEAENGGNMVSHAGTTVRIACSSVNKSGVELYHGGTAANNNVLKTVANGVLFRGNTAHQNEGIQIEPRHAAIGNGGGRIFWRENSNNLYGFSLDYGGDTDNKFRFKRHDNNRTGIDVFTVNRGSSDMLFGGQLRIKGRDTGKYLRIGGSGQADNNQARISVTNGNLHIESATGSNILFLNHYNNKPVYIGNELVLNNANTKLHQSDGNSVKLQTNSGYLDFGCKNPSHCHFYTDRSNYYFNKEIIVDSGIIGSYDEDLQIRRASSTKFIIYSNKNRSLQELTSVSKRGNESRVLTYTDSAYEAPNFAIGSTGSGHHSRYYKIASWTQNGYYQSGTLKLQLTSRTENGIPNDYYITIGFETNNSSGNIGNAYLNVHGNNRRACEWYYKKNGKTLELWFKQNSDWMYAYARVVAQSGHSPVFVGNSATTSKPSGLITATKYLSYNDTYFGGFVRTGRQGIKGDYDSAYVQGIWSIGEGWKVNNKDFGNQYGIVYAHTNAGSSTGKQPISGWGHQICFTDNGNRKAVISMTSGHIRSFGNIYGVQMYCDNDVMSGTGGALVCRQTGGTDKTTGLSLYNGSIFAQEYGIQFMKTSIYGKHGSVQGDWAMYFNMSNTSNRGWIFRPKGGSLAASISTSGHLTTKGNVTAYSDERLKSNIQDLEFRGDLKPKTYIKDGKEEIGFIAQEVKALYPELVHGEEKEDEYLSLNYGGLTAVLMAKIKTLEEKINELENGIRK